MDKQENQSKWDELARELGAEIPPESDRPKPPKVEDAGPTAPAEPPKPRSAPPKRAADWASLSSQLGLPPIAPESAAIAQEAPPAARQAPDINEAVADSPPAPAQRGRDADAADRRPPRPPRQQDAAREAEGRGRARRGDRGEDRDGPRRSRRDRGGDRRETSDDRAAPRTPPAAKRPVSPPPEPTSPEPPPKPAGGVSLWQKIFGSPAEQSAKLANASADDEADQGASEHRSPQRPAERESAELPPEDASAEIGITAPDATKSGDEFDEQAPAGRKRRRSRRRGRGRKPEEGRDNRRGAARSQDSQLMETPGADDFDEDFVDLDGDGSAETGFDSEPLFDDEGEAGEGRGSAVGEAAPAKSRSASHRSIPSWEDAIGMIVESNMQTRSQRRPSSQSGPRGRSRGGRRRRKS